MKTDKITLKNGKVFNVTVEYTGKYTLEEFLKRNMKDILSTPPR